MKSAGRTGARPTVEPTLPEFVGHAIAFTPIATTYVAIYTSYGFWLITGRVEAFSTEELLAYLGTTPWVPVGALS